MRRPVIRQLLFATVVISSMVSVGQAETVNVNLSGSSFTPANIEITTGDTVRWTWVSGLHNVVSGVNGAHDGNFTSGTPINFPGNTFEVIFDQAFLDANPMPGNSYPYYCAVHLTFGMVGSVTVADPKILCPSDCDGSGDGEVNVTDLLSLLAQWGTNGSCDTNGNGIDVVDLLALLSAWGPCP